MKKKEEINGQDIYCYETIANIGSNKSKSKSKNRKNNNRRKKEKKRQQQLREHLAQWIGKIYRLEATYDSLEQEIIKYLTAHIDFSTFQGLLHKIIENQVERIAENIGEITQEICQLYREGAINPSLTAALYEKIQIVIQASPQIQNIINYFTLVKDKSQSYVQQYLDKTTLKFIFESDNFRHLKDQFVSICQRFLQMNQSSKDQRQKVLFKKILEIIQTIEQFDQFQSDLEDQQQYDDEYPYEKYAQNQQIVQQQKKYDHEGKQNRYMIKQEEIIQQKPKKKKKNKKKKINKEIYVSEQYVEEVIYLLHTLAIDKRQRKKACFPYQDQEQWLQEIIKKYEQKEPPST